MRTEHSKSNVLSALLNKMRTEHSKSNVLSASLNKMRTEHILGVRFLEKCRPELVPRFRMQEDQSTLAGRKVVVDDNILPHSTPPEVEMEHSNVLILRTPFL